MPSSRTPSSTSASIPAFPRTRETAELALGGRHVPIEVEPRLDDIKIGELDGEPLARYREVKRGLGRKQPFPGGESLDAAALRYAEAFDGLAGRRRNASSSSATRSRSGTR